ncbi:MULTISPECIES: hypothetical protein [Pseudomonas]|uniref:Uncharacterized protein n=2 Tax=Pseudomonas TaxID=286 RepID=A0A0G3GPH1_9PSED|nr:hypothetical protein [Pseudomonas brassicacearum]AKK00627.1 hypothetical protein VM99_22095 [Pseudomonas chlororaphis]ROM83398.1 hypothetical protein BK652_13750 [Pseudomonas brassicacearum]
MSAIHEQAMTHVYQQVLQRLLGFYSRAERTALQLLIQRLIVAAGGIDRMGDYRVLTVQNGSRDGFYVLTALRAAQLSIAGRHPATFALRVATPRLSQTTQATLENIHRCYSALFVYDDPRVELLMADNREVVPFNHTQPLSVAGHEANRMDMLVLGHLRAVDSPLEVGDEGYLAMAEFYRHMARWEAGVDSLVSSDTPRQQKNFMSGLRRAAGKIGLVADSGNGFDSLFAQLDTLGSELYGQVYGPEHLVPWQPEGHFEACRRVGHIGIDDLTVDRLEGTNWPLFNEFLRVQTENLIPSTSENEYLSPLLSAHLHGLQACYLHGRSYEAGYGDYAQRAVMIMHRKQLPEYACEQAQAMFGSPLQIPQRRVQAAQEAQKIMGLSETQLVCMLFAPFVEEGAGLEHFLRCCHPGMLVAMPDLHKAMQGAAIADQVAHWMVDVSGLPMDVLGTLYRSSVTRSERLENQPEHDLQQALDGADAAQAEQGDDDLCERSARH